MWGGREELGQSNGYRDFFASARRSTGWAKFKKEGDNWPYLLPNFGRWCRINCAKLLPVSAYRAAPLKPRPGAGCLWVW
jgi:hypothetical protein